MTEKETMMGTEKDVFSPCHERGTKKKILRSFHEESNVRPSDSKLRCFTIEPQRLW